MGQVLHGCATTTHAVRTAIQRSKAPLKEQRGGSRNLAGGRLSMTANDVPWESPGGNARH
jgi:hypothetical protein